MRITRFPNLSEQQFLGCTAAFVDSLSGELNSAALALRKLENGDKGSAFAYEMTLDNHRYGALILLDRWSSLIAAFGPHLDLDWGPGIIKEAEHRISNAEAILYSVNLLIDGADMYSSEVVEACTLAFRTVDRVFAEERAQAQRCAALGPMLSEEYREARRIFLEDLAAR